MFTLSIIEDEPAIRREISFLVAQEKDIELVGSAGSVQTAFELICEKTPDVILMDIQLRDGTAFDLLKKLSPIPQNIIFITAYNHFAIKAIKFGALDYLLKPINKLELRESLERFRRRREHNPAWMEQLTVTQTAMEAKGVPESIVLSSVNHFRVVSVGDIVYCKSDGPYSTFYLKDGCEVIMSKALKHYQELLPPPYFLRTHQSYLVNRDYITDTSRNDHITLQDGTKIPISQRRRSIVLTYLSPEK
ncbi:MAG: LytTR family DNA-binding domain-containing protein [Sphingobacterium sp.]|jgi:two-component system LytT family response regulator|nr:LytTR family DNA-binding domain-containing protein [Sphingobacterium sp.]